MTPVHVPAFLERRTTNYYKKTGHLLFSDYLAHEQENKTRLIGQTEYWHWLAAFAPEGFYEIWAIHGRLLRRPPRITIQVIRSTAKTAMSQARTSCKISLAHQKVE